MDDEEVISLEVLGRWNASVRSCSVRTGLRQQRLLAALAVHGIRSRRFLSGLLWPECTESHAQGSLRAAVFTLSRRLPGAVACDGSDLALGNRVDVDLHRLRRILDRPESFVPTSEEGRWFLDHSHAELLPGWYDDWVLDEAARLTEDYVDFVEAHAQGALAEGDPYQALLLARVARQCDPLRESAVHLLIRGHLILGNEAAALHEFRDHCAAVGRELGASPSAQLADLFRAQGHA